MQNSNYRKLLNLKLFRKPFALYTHETPEKGFEVMKIVKTLGLEENWVELLANFVSIEKCGQNAWQEVKK